MAILLFQLIFSYIIPVPFYNPPGKHPLHVSTTSIRWNDQNHKLEITCTLFADDFETVLTKTSPYKTDLGNSSARSKTERLIKSYFSRNLALNTSKEAIPITYLGFEKTFESVDVYLSSPPVAELKQLAVTVTLLHDLYDDQLNIVHLISKGKRSTARLDYPERNIKLSF